MFCPNCHTEISEGSTFCGKCGAQINSTAPNSASPITVKTYLAESIIVTLCCCLPFGIVSIIYASKANTCVAHQDLFGAQQNANQAKKWCWIAFWCGLGCNIIYAGIEMIAVIAGAN